MLTQINMILETNEMEYGLDKETINNFEPYFLSVKKWMKLYCTVPVLKATLDQDPMLI